MWWMNELSMSKFIAGWLKLDPGLMNGGPSVYELEHGAVQYGWEWT